ncbi:uncharacterized protein PFL1_05910 [Pseudozyma flocculosa PF-1]|uniref:Uncharacterized protein n=2 Tax=Pseudozyma flocculosa TaxID=84751 RepID=A0A5C3F3Z9_9BASI|nr:uncharacterized protein PFL1_05910 [Pseudozyma flocculosa PF-1]EPQ26589.1 hypothetical protein PFL1_05910 [Pseudozyma flocculosa PF-1]SPO38417.1 uncharacterized protein PSFLO_03895 [Pseudozyma flocculosa]
MFSSSFNLSYSLRYASLSTPSHKETFLASSTSIDMSSTETFRVGDRVLFSIGQHEEEGVIESFTENTSHEQVAIIGYIKKSDAKPTSIHRKVDGLTKIRK